MNGRVWNNMEKLRGAGNAQRRGSGVGNEVTAALVSPHQPFHKLSFNSDPRKNGFIKASPGRLASSRPAGRHFTGKEKKEENLTMRSSRVAAFSPLALRHLFVSSSDSDLVGGSGTLINTIFSFHQCMVGVLLWM